MINMKEHIGKGEKILYEGTPSWWAYFWHFVFFWLYFIPLIVAVLDKNSKRYVITNKRIMYRKGILSEEVKSATFKHITSVHLRKSLLGRIFNVGDLIIDTAGSGLGVDFVWRGVEDPASVKRKIEKHIE